MGKKNEIQKRAVTTHMLHYGALAVLVIIAMYGCLAVLDAIVGNIFTIGSSQPGMIIISVTAIASLITIGIVAAQTITADKLTRIELAESRAKEDAERDKVITLINSITDAVFSIDQHGAIGAYNSAALNLLDTNESVYGRPIDDMIRLETVEGIQLNIFDQLSRSTFIRQRDDIIMRVNADDILRLEATFAPVQSDSGSASELDSYVLILRDITRMKSLEEERDEFISVVSHELRTPIAIAEGSLGNAELLAERGLEGKTTEAIREAHKQVLFLARMMNDLSTLSRAERGVSDEAEDIDVTELANQLHSEYAPHAEEKGLRLDLDVQGKPGNLHVSRLYLQELLQNFMTNAIKYTNNGSITFRVIPADDTVCFEVSDTGIGIGKADLANIFKRFYRAEDYRTRETNGTGLGLYVADKLARKLGCEIEVTSRLNHGSTFRFALPIAASKKTQKQ